MPIILFIFNILISMFFYLDLHLMCNVFLDEYLNMLSINDMLNPECSEGNNSGPAEGNNSGGTGPDSGDSATDGGDNIRNNVERKFRIQYDYNKNVPINKRPDVYSHEGEGKLNGQEVEYIHRNVHLNPL